MYWSLFAAHATAEDEDGFCFSCVTVAKYCIVLFMYFNIHNIFYVRKLGISSTCKNVL